MLRLREKEKRREGRPVKRERGEREREREREREKERMHCWLTREIGLSASEEKERQCLIAIEKRDGEKEGI
jgi:hypothetical protein